MTTLHVGTKVSDRYRIEGELGRGGMGIVYSVRHLGLDKLMAMKVLRTDCARDEDAVRRFVLEARASSAIGHPSIVCTNDFGQLADDSFYFVMEHVEGESLRVRLRREGPL